MLIQYKSGGILNLVALRDLLAQDKEMIRKWRNNPNVTAHMYSQHEIGAEEHDRWFKNLALDPRRRYWIILYESRPVGVSNLADIDEELRCAEFGIYLGEDEVRGKGVGTCAQFLLTEYAFNSMNLDRLSCEVLADNRDALRMYKKVGLQQLGRRKQRVNQCGKSFDIYQLTISKDQWGHARESLLKRLGNKNSL